ncbi:diguanylate cyclase [Sulfurospirillum sp. T05]|uniref:diguanylate cyclase n=1 Tax=Sulfurospirillum tamanense TaxID=2813362 RepID=A0ABS2WU85_9BACT|nr:diguanylate cyclase [Sulfurospirillum tamanensis]MBN2964749.1 diguanylate cyclase [Sulfurospirillum tamanensis]
MREKILLVEDNKALAKLLAKKTESSLGMQVDVAHSMEEAKVFLKHANDYFIALLDLNLPDAPDGEIVDYVLELGMLVIVLTGNIDKKTKALFEEKPIVDYVFKGNMDDVNYIFSMIDRLRKNTQHKVLVVDSAITSRNRTKMLLQSQQFKVLVAAHGEEALRYFEDHDDISLVVTDYHMPVINGMELVLELRKTKSKHELGIIAISSSEEESMAAKFLKHGANDFIIKPFGKEELTCRVNNTIEAMENIETIAMLGTTDGLTGALERRHFLRQVEAYLDEAKEKKESYAFGIVDIDQLKAINETHGYEAGDRVLSSVASTLRGEAKGVDAIGRFGGAEFGVLLKHVSKEEALRWFVKMRAHLANQPLHVRGKEVRITVSMGLAFEGETQVESLLERADEALGEAKHQGRNRVEIYEERA